MNYAPKTGKERTIEILRNNRAMHKRRAKEWRKHAEEQEQEVRRIDLELRELGEPHEEDIEGRQLDLVEYISVHCADSNSEQSAVGSNTGEPKQGGDDCLSFASAQYKRPPE